jgi:hypothetical protein
MSKFLKAAGVAVLLAADALASTGKPCRRTAIGLPRISNTCLDGPFAKRLKRSPRRSTAAAFQKRTGIRLNLDWQHDGQAAASLADQLVLMRIHRSRACFRLHVDQSTKPNWAIGKF